MTNRRALNRLGLTAAITIVTSLGACVDLALPPELRPGAIDAPEPIVMDAGQVDQSEPVDRPQPQPEVDGAPPDREPDAHEPNPDATQLGSGLRCATSRQCASGHCVDGVCCQTACAGSCMACNVPGSVGTCAPAAAGTDPDNDCGLEAADTCGRDGTCDGNGGCRLHVTGTTCGAGSCAADVATAPRTCDGLGTCRPGGTKPCAPYKCAADACSITCASDTDCGSGSRCESGKCTGPLPAGQPCMTGNQCASGQCADGVCCGTACGGLCESCNQPNNAGICMPIPAGQDPTNECAPDPAMPCGKDGMCDGRGACRLQVAGTVCAAATCQANMATASRTCDGNGVCQPATATSCNGYACAGTTCATACTTSADCAGANVCIGGTCRAPKAAGETCAAPGECASRLCEQGVCCSTQCTGMCRSCAVPGMAGTCALVPAGMDPVNHCTASDPSTCGFDGQCDGAGGCRRYAAGTACVAASCATNVLTPARTCDGNGTCQPAGTTSSCAPYVCQGAACRTSCANDSHCQAGSTCTDGKCASPKKANSEPCAAATECLSGFCAQGVCCNTACTAGCLSCALTGTVGTCTNVPSGQDPKNACNDGGAATCGDDGSCNGAGACRKYAAGTQCAAAACTNGSATPARTCDGNGSCRTAIASSCGRYRCGGTQCLQSCNTSNDCVSPNVCSGSACGGLKGQYYRSEDFTNLALTRVDGQVNFDWGFESPDASIPEDDFFSVRWTGKVIPRYSEEYVFEADVDTSVRIWINNAMVFEFEDGEEPLVYEISLSAGQQYDIRIEYWTSDEEAYVTLTWTSASQGEEVVPTSQLVPAP